MISESTLAPPERILNGSALEVFRVALRLGLTSFGGPVAHLGYFRREYVERRRWLDDGAFADLVALVQLLPGPASSELGIAIGTRRAGMLGGVAAWLGFTLPSAIALGALGIVATSADLSQQGWVHGLQLAAVAVVALAVISMASTLTPDAWRRAVALVAAAVALAWAVPAAQVAIIAGGAVAGLLFASRQPVPASEARDRPIASISPRVGIASLATLGALLVLLPVAARVDANVAGFFDAFFRAGALVFGGGHVVLPLLHSTVVEPGWVGEGSFLAGYGAAQAVPGPLFTFAAYLGAASSVIPNGVPGAAVAVVAIFLPAFLLVFGTLPFWDRLRAWSTFRRALAGTNAAVVGLLLAALYSPVATGALTDLLDLVVVLLALVLLASRRVSVIVVVLALAVLGQALAIVGG